MEIDMGACPVTGLHIVQKPHWTDIPISDKYSVTFQMIGNHILHLLPKGNSATIDVDKLYYHREQVLKESTIPGVKIVEIKNCKDIFGSPLPSDIKNIDRELQEIGVDRILVKPLTREDLKRVLHQELIKGKKPKQETIKDTGAISPPSALENEKQLTVLLAEDHPINRKLVDRFLKIKGWTVIHAENGIEAVQKYKENDVDIILMDIQMPVMDGYEAARQIRQLEADSGKQERIPIIALTAHALESYREKSYSSGMDDCLTKPINPEKLYQLVHRLTSAKSKRH
jgi:CheY-like chemotaxis protein